MGRWLHSAPAAVDALAPALTRDQVEQELTRSAQALHDIGYFGPFGIDAFEFETAQGALGFQPRCEINARFSMGYPRELPGACPSRGYVSLFDRACTMTKFPRQP